MDQIILLYRNKTIYANEKEAWDALNSLTHKKGQPVIALYKLSNSVDGSHGSSNIGVIFAIGTEDGVGKYKACSSHDDMLANTKLLKEQGQTITGILDDIRDIKDFKGISIKINNVQLKSDNSLDELGIADKNTVTGILESVGDIENSIGIIEGDVNGLSTNLVNHIDDFEKFKAFFENLFEYDEANEAIKAKYNFYTDKCISAGGLNKNNINIITSYDELKNKPFINGQELLSGENSLDKLGIQPKGEYADKSTVEGILKYNTTITANIKTIEDTVKDLSNNFNTHIDDFKDFNDFKTLFEDLFEYDAAHSAIKARYDFYTDTGKCISAGGLNNNVGEIEVISSYSELKDKPYINGQELLSGDNSLDKLGIQPKGDYTTNAFVESITNAIIEKLNLHIKDFEDFVNTLNTYFQFDSEHQAIKVLYDLYTDNGKNISAGGYNNSGTEIIIPTSYPELTNKPKINGIELVGNLTSEDLGLQLGGDYLTVSDILNNIKQADGTTKQYIKSELLPEVTSNKGIEVLQTASKTQIDLIVDTDTFSFGENKELQIKKIDGGIFL